MNDAPPEDAPASAAARRWRLWSALPFVLIAIFVTWRVLVDHGSPRAKAPEWLLRIFEDRWQAYRFMAWLCIPMALLAVARVSARVRAWCWRAGASRLLALGLGAMVLVAGLNYAYAARALRQAGFAHQHDSYHYTLAPKYLAQTGYDDFYACVIRTRIGAQISNRARMRDLHRYENTSAGERRRDAKESRRCRESFSPARWESFQRDLEGIWTNWAGQARIAPSAVRDNGYNGTPFHAYVMTAWTRALGPLDLGRIARMFLADIWGLCALGWALCLAFGWRVGLGCAVFAFVNAADRIDIVGGSPGRYFWYIALGLGVVALVRERWARASVGLTTATALVAMPFLFWLGGLLAVAGEALRRNFAPIRRFALGSAVSGAILLGLGAAHASGTRNYVNWADNMQMHTQGLIPRGVTPGPVSSTPGFGLGLKFALMQGPLENGKGPRLVRIEAYRSIRPWLIGLGLAMTAVAAALASRLRPAAATVLFGMVAFYALQGTVGYYFVCASLLPLILAAGWRPGGKVGVMEAAPVFAQGGRTNAAGVRHAPWLCALLEFALYLGNAAALWDLAATENRMRMYNRNLSVGLGVWLALALVVFAVMVWPRRIPAQPDENAPTS